MFRRVVFLKYVSPHRIYRIIWINKEMGSKSSFSEKPISSMLLNTTIFNGDLTEPYESMRKWDHDLHVSGKIDKQIVAFKGTQKNNVNMIFECDASRLAIYISWGHRDTVVCFWNSSKKSKNGPTSGIKISARSPIYPENEIFNDVLDICFKESVFF